MTETPNDPTGATEPTEPAASSEQHHQPADGAAPIVPAEQPEATPASPAQTAQQPGTEPTGQTPAAQTPATQQPGDRQPGAQQPTAELPDAAAAAAGSGHAGQPEPPTAQPETAQPATAQPATAQPATAQPATAQPLTPQQQDQMPTADYGAGAFGQPPATGQNPYAAPQPPAGNPYANQQNPYGHAPIVQPYGQRGAQQQYAGQQPHTAQFAQQAGQPGPQHQGQHPQGAQPTAQQPRTEDAADKSRRKRGAGLVIAGLAIGAIIGGASGAGVMGIVQASQPQTTPSASTGAANITVNNANDATVVTAVAAKASPSVVTINVNGTRESGTGSGIVLSSDGYVLTNTHVVTLDGEIAHPTITVTDNNGKIYTAKVVGTDPVVDLAVIKLNGASGMTPATFANSDKLNVGDTAVAIGAPLGLSGTVTDGIVSSLNRSIQIASSAAPSSGDQQQDNGGNGDNNFWNFDLPGQGNGNGNQSASNYISLPVIQTDAAINPGNSGGALLNAKGQVIGINVAIASASQTSSSSDQSGSIGVGFAIPSNLGQRVANELIKNGKATHGLLGATVEDTSSSKGATTVGARIASVTSGGAASKAGLQAGDIVTNFNGIPITSPTDLTAQVRYLAAGSTADLIYQRDGKSYTVKVTLGSLPANS